MLTSQTSSRSQRDLRYPKRLEGGKSPSNYNLEEAFILCIRIQKCLWDHRCTASGCWKWSAQEKGKTRSRSAQTKGDPLHRGRAAGGNGMMSSNCRSVGRWTDLQCLPTSSVTHQYRQKHVLISHKIGWWEGPISCPGRVCWLKSGLSPHWRGGRFLNWNLNCTRPLWFPKYVFIVINRNRRWRES